MEEGICHVHSRSSRTFKFQECFTRVWWQIHSGFHSGMVADTLGFHSGMVADTPGFHLGCSWLIEDEGSELQDQPELLGILSQINNNNKKTLKS